MGMRYLSIYQLYQHISHEQLINRQKKRNFQTKCECVESFSGVALHNNNANEKNSDIH